MIWSLKCLILKEIIILEKECNLLAILIFFIPSTEALILSYIYQGPAMLFYFCIYTLDVS